MHPLGVFLLTFILIGCIFVFTGGDDASADGDKTMARYILIDNCSGYIFGDTADLGMLEAPATIVDAARALDGSIGEHGRDYAECGLHDLASNQTGYHVYRADIDGSEALPVVHDGQDAETIASVTEHCQYVGSVECITVDA